MSSKTVIVEQLRAARAALRWNVDKLSSSSKLSVRTIKMVETQIGEPQCKSSTLAMLVSAFEAAGIEFVGTPEDGPGIRLRMTTPDAAE